VERQQWRANHLSEASVNYENIFDEKHGWRIVPVQHARTHQQLPGSYVLSLPYRHQGIAARATYSFMDKYFVEGNFGYNGSENFAPANDSDSFHPLH
jgi:hypothetical protein